MTHIYLLKPIVSPSYLAYLYISLTDPVKTEQIRVVESSEVISIMLVLNHNLR